MSTPVETGVEIRPFEVEIAGEALEDLRGRVEATRWPTDELVPDASQGVQSKTLQELTRYWANDYDFGRVAARLNELPQFKTEIDGVGIHFIHVRSRHENALPLIVTHGWPGSVIELLGAVGPLTDPVAHGWAALMRRLGYDRYVAQGGDQGASVTDAMARQAPDGLAGIHLNLLTFFPTDVLAAVFGGGPVPEGLVKRVAVALLAAHAERKDPAALEAVAAVFKRGYFVEMPEHPQTIGYALTDTPAGLAA